MEELDLLFEQIAKRTKHKSRVREVADEIKQALIDESDDCYRYVGGTGNHLIDAIEYVREKVNTATTTELDYHLLRLMLLYQRIFYKHSSNIDAEQLDWYLTLRLNVESVYELFVDGLKDVKPIEFTYKLDFSKPLPCNIADIERFCDSMQIAAKTYSTRATRPDCIPEVKGMMPFLAFHQEAIGNEAVWYKKVKYWLACNEAYKLHIIKGLGKSDVVRALAGSPESSLFNFNQDDMPNAIHKLDGFLNDAKKCIASAEQGIFPY